MNTTVDAESVEIREGRKHWEIVNKWFDRPLGNTYIVWSKEAALQKCEEEFPGLPVKIKELE
ncbi:MAG: hypothetical protein GY880_03075 [Planctomycetaceae bacterium]|nr:hypothetical protein [Planctomycetaceae bacterium]